MTGLSQSTISESTGYFLFEYLEQHSYAYHACVLSYRYVIMTLQAGDWACGVLGAFAADRGGQWLLYQPNIPVDDAVF